MRRSEFDSFYLITMLEILRLDFYLIGFNMLKSRLQLAMNDR